MLGGIAPGVPLPHLSPNHAVRVPRAEVCAVAFSAVEGTVRPYWVTAPAHLCGKPQRDDPTERDKLPGQRKSPSDLSHALSLAILQLVHFRVSTTRRIDRVEAVAGQERCGWTAGVCLLLLPSKRASLPCQWHGYRRRTQPDASKDGGSQEQEDGPEEWLSDVEGEHAGPGSSPPIPPSRSGPGDPAERPEQEHGKGPGDRRPAACSRIDCDDTRRCTNRRDYHEGGCIRCDGRHEPIMPQMTRGATLRVAPHRPFIALRINHCDRQHHVKG